MTITPADNPCNCRACGALILNEVSSMCEDCEADMNAYYDEREDAERDRQMTEDNYIRENYDTPIGELYGGD